MIKEIKKILVYFIIIIATLISLEILTRILFSEFRNNYFYDIRTTDRIEGVSRGVNYKMMYFNTLKSFIRVQDFDQQLKFDSNKKNIFLLGDSVAGGYGVEYNNSFFKILENIINKESINDYSYYNISENGSSLEHIILWLKENENLIDNNDIIIYEFNYNDITPSNLEYNNFITHKQSMIVKFRNYSRSFRKTYLNYSSFARLLQHHAGIISRNTSGECIDRKFDALGQYTYSFGAKGFEKESNILWEKFDSQILSILDILGNERRKNFIVSISPISIQVNNHEDVNKFKLDINCATIDPRQNIMSILKKYNVSVSDPLVRFNNFAKNNLDKNYFLFHNHDTNHPNELGHKLIGIDLSDSIMSLEDK